MDLKRMPINDDGMETNLDDMALPSSARVQDILDIRLKPPLPLEQWPSSWVGTMPHWAPGCDRWLSCSTPGHFTSYPGHPTVCSVRAIRLLSEAGMLLGLPNSGSYPIQFKGNWRLAVSDSPQLIYGVPLNIFIILGVWNYIIYIDTP